MNRIKIWRSNSNIFVNYKTKDFVWIILEQRWFICPYIKISETEIPYYESTLNVKLIESKLLLLDFKWEGWDIETVFKHGAEYAARELLRTIRKQTIPIIIL